MKDFQQKLIDLFLSRGEYREFLSRGEFHFVLGNKCGGQTTLEINPHMTNWEKSYLHHCDEEFERTEHNALIERLKRLERHELSAGSGSGGDCWLDSEPSVDGDWVNWSDVEALIEFYGLGD